MFAKVFVCCCVAVAVVARPDQPPQSYNYQPPQQQAASYQAPQQQASYQAPSNRQQSYQQQDSQDGMPFNYAFEVNDQYSGLDFGHNTNSDGKVTTGEYRVLLPDGRTQIVTYTVDDYNGYQADVTYEGEARPHQDSHSYGASQVSYSHREPVQQSYGQPEPVQQSYGQPEPVKQTYGQPQSSYVDVPQQPLPTYNLPKTTYSQAKNSKPLETIFRSQF